jgi:hypothetical protein
MSGMGAGRLPGDDDAVGAVQVAASPDRRHQERSHAVRQDHTQVRGHVPDPPSGAEALSFPLLRAESIEHVGDGSAFGRDDREVVHVDQPSPALFAGATGKRSRG